MLKHVSLHLLTALLLFSLCSEETGPPGEAADDSIYLAQNLPNNYKVDPPASMVDVSGSLNKPAAVGRALDGVESEAYTELQEVIGEMRKIYLEESIELEYLMADIFYPGIIDYLEANPSATMVPEDALEVQLTTGMLRRLETNLRRYASESEIDDYLAELAADEMGAGDYVYNPNVQHALLTDDPAGMDEELKYWFSDEPDFITRIAWNNEKTRVSISYSQTAALDPLYEPDLAGAFTNNDFTWKFSLLYDDTTLTQTMRDLFKVYDSGQVNMDYDYQINLKECGASDCVKLSVQSTFVEPAWVFGDDCDGNTATDDTLTGSEDIIAHADNTGGLVQIDGNYTCSTNAFTDSYKYLEEFSGTGDLLGWWEDIGGDWENHLGVVETSPGFLNSSYYTDEFSNGVSIGVGVSVSGGIFDATSGIYDVAFVLLHNSVSCSADASTIENFILGDGYYYFDDASPSENELDISYWGSSDYVTSLSLLVCEESFDQASGTYTYSEISGAAVSLAN